MYLDLCGIIPTYDEAMAFLDDAAPDKRTRLIDRLLADPRYAQHQADVWDMMLFGRNPPGYDADKRPGFQHWLRDAVRQEHGPTTRWVGELLQGRREHASSKAPPMFYVQYKNQPEDATRRSRRRFSACNCNVPAATIIRSRPGRSSTSTAWRRSSPGCEVVTVGKKDKLRTMYAIGEKNSGDMLFTGPAKNSSRAKRASR